MSFLFNLSENVTKSIVNTAVAVAINFVTTCGAQLKSTQTINLDGCVFKGRSITADQIGVGVVKCAQDVSNSAQIQTLVQQAVQQAAEAAAQQLGLLDLGRAAIQIGKNYATTVQNLSETITENFTVACTAEFTSTQEFNCHNSQVYLSDGLHLSSYQSSLLTCTQNAVSTTSVYNDLRQIISQSAVTREESIFSFWIVAVLVLIAFISVIGIALRSGAFSPSGGATTPQARRTGIWIIIGIVIVVSLLIIGYTWLASTNGWWPFLPTTNSDVTGYQVA
jgi:hypothetical protein